jgi:hypothetical protein
MKLVASGRRLFWGSEGKAGRTEELPVGGEGE